MPSVITPENCDSIIKEIQSSKDKRIDFSGTNFELLGHEKITALFVALCNLQRPCALILNDCILNTEFLSTLTLGFKTTPQLETIVLRRAIASKETLLAVAESFARNHALKYIHVDGHKLTSESAVKVIPYTVREALCKHPTAILLIDGLKVEQAKPSNNVTYVSFFIDEKNRSSESLEEKENKHTPNQGDQKKLGS
jgi:hypothetical protein